MRNCLYTVQRMLVSTAAERGSKTDALRLLMCIYATLTYILLQKSQILKCPAWESKAQTEQKLCIAAVGAYICQDPSRQIPYSCVLLKLFPWQVSRGPRKGKSGCVANQHRVWPVSLHGIAICHSNTV